MNASPSPAVPDSVTLVTADVDAARAFYADLLGWTYTDSADGTAALAGGQPAAELRVGDGPARWWTTFAVDDADVVRDAAARGGARVDGDDIHDPFGGAFRVRVGSPVGVPGPGRPCWYEYMTTVPGDVERFYADTLALRATVPPGAPDDSYALLISGGRPVAGRLALPAPLDTLLPTGWLVYFAVADPDGAAEQAQRHGGRLLVPPRDVATGRVAALADPTGAVFTVIRPAAGPA
ncbi:VOC family protein [Micromonospora sp. CPCC 205547]|uniref:VOC family protein n=1 Tax=Micromonospora sp. CPCC 205547 TaxID=3122400 RepID=UPI003B969946